MRWPRAQALQIPRIELDAIHWKPNWVSSTTEEMRPIIEREISNPTWVLDGNYWRLRGIIWPRADTIIWLDYPMRIVFSRVFFRTMRRWWRNELLWNTNRERLFVQFCTEDSIFLWVINTWRKRHREYPPLLREAQQQGKRVLRFRSPEAAEAWMRDILPRTLPIIP